MKATSKLISVVLILALCLSVFTVPAFADSTVTITAPAESGKVTGNTYKGSAAGQASVQDGQNNVQADVQNRPAEANNAVIGDDVTVVANALELQVALESRAASIQLSEQIDWVGSLVLEYDVSIDLGGKGKGLAFSGSGDAAIVSSAKAELFNGNIFVSGVSVDEEGDSVPGFRTVATSTEFGSVYLHGVYVKYTEAGDNSIFGTGVSLGNGTFSQDVSAYYGEGELESGYVVNDQTADGGMFDVTAKSVSTEEGDDAAKTDDVDTEDGEVVSLTGVYGEGADRIVVTVSARNLPEGLRVEVTPADNSILKAGEDEEVLFVVDITLYMKDENGEDVEYEPVDDPNVKEVNVTIRHPALGNVEDGDAVTLYHIVKGEAVPVAEQENVAGQTTMEFTTDSFSYYGATANTTTGSDGDVHYRVVTIGTEKEIYYYGNDIDVYYTGNKAPEQVSLMPYELALKGEYDLYKMYLLDYSSEEGGTTDYTLDEVNQKITILGSEADVLDKISDGKYGVVFWYMDGNTRVYMVQPLIITTTKGVEGVGDNFAPDKYPDLSKGFFDVEMCDYDSVKVKLTDELASFEISGAGTDPDPIKYEAGDKKVTINGKTYHWSELFSVEEYTAVDPAGHEFIAGKYLTLNQSLIKLLGFHDDYDVTLKVTQGEGESEATGEFYLSITPGIRVADGLDDYIKGKNLWVKFESCAPIDYDADGTLAIWIGGQKISHDYYSISNDHCTLWIYRNLLDQLKSNNRYTLKARLWAFDNNKVKQTWYPATASFNVLAAGSTSSKSPKTGDESNVALWASVLVLSGGAVIALIPKKRKSK